jgi:hypothetical protein
MSISYLSYNTNQNEAQSIAVNNLRVYGTETAQILVVTDLTVTGFAAGDFPSTTSNYALFVNVGAQPGTIAAGQPLTFGNNEFPNANITAVTETIAPFPASGTIFTLANIGAYQVTFQGTFNENGSVQLYLGNTVAACVPFAYTLVGRATGTNQAIMSTIVKTTVANSALALCAAAGNSVALTFPSPASTTNAGIQSISIVQIA